MQDIELVRGGPASWQSEPPWAQRTKSSGPRRTLQRPALLPRRGSLSRLLYVALSFLWPVGRDQVIHKMNESALSPG